MYHVIGTIITISLLYVISFSFYRLGLFSQALHRKLWNSILAITFLFTAIAGVLMALQINFKWDIPIVNYILKWHVEAGVVLAITGIFHFIWHLSYFGRIFSTNESPVLPYQSKEINPFGLTANLFVIGFTSTSVQILLMREIMNISGGYELITGLFLGSWLIASAGGAALASRSQLNNLPKINLVFSISPVISLILLMVLSRLFLKNGETPSFLITTIITLLILAPFCLISGFAFTKIMSFARDMKILNPGNAFSIETTGGIIAGVLISVFTAGMINTYLLLILITFLTIAYSILTFFSKTRRTGNILKVSFTVLTVIIILSGPDKIFRQLLLPGINVKETTDTPYGNITTGEYSGEQTIYYNQRLVAYNDDVIEREEDIHYALLQRDNPENIVLISGSLASLLPEILKYKVKSITFIERDPALAKLAMPMTNLGSARLLIKNQDAFSYIRHKEDSSDAVLMLLPPPSTLSLNRYYTQEFFNDVKKYLTKGGIFLCSPGPGENYLNEEAINLYSSIFNTLTRSFRFVRPVVGNKLYFIASDKELSVSFCKLAEERGIKNIYVNEDFLADDLTEIKSNEIAMLIDPEIRINKSAFPIACLYFQNYDFSKNLGEKIPAIIIIILVFALPVLAVRKRDILMYFSASALAGFEIIILLTVQITVGNVYQFTGMVIASLMAGLAVGAGAKYKLPHTISLNIKASFLIIYYIVIALGYNFITDLRGVTSIILLIIISVLIPSFLTGNLFRELTVSDKTGTSPGMTYSADLAGSALGFILVSGVAVPLLGIRVSIFLIAALILCGILFGTNRNKY